SVAFSPDGKQVVSGSDDKTVRIWDVESGQVAAGPFEGHTSSVYSVAFSPDGKQVVSGSDDKTVRIWDVESDHFKILFSLGGPCIYASCHENGWVKSKNGDVLLWIPNHLRAGLCDFDTISIMGQVILCRLNLSNFFHGCDWTNCFTLHIKGYVFSDYPMLVMYSSFFSIFFIFIIFLHLFLVVFYFLNAAFNLLHLSYIVVTL
ncbi:WD40-repeat-containing domain protein, partial [Cyathus striatus]